MISISEFQRLDLRVGQIVQAAAIPATDRLLQVEVDLGDERRTLVAGVARHYAPDELVGSRVIVAANVEPATIRGVRSEGMLLGANCHTRQQIALLTVNREVANGTRVE
jgi:methionine--tRNA ligase beta chain